MDRALAAVAEHQPDVAFLDIRMPGMDGMTLLSRLHEIDAELPVILVTGHAEVPLAVEAIRGGAYDFIEKPFVVQELATVIRRAVDHRGLVLANRRLRAVARDRHHGLRVARGEDDAVREFTQNEALVLTIIAYMQPVTRGAISRLTGRTLVLDPNVSGVVTVVSAEPLSSAGVWELFLSVLRTYGFAAVRSGAVWRSGSRIGRSGASIRRSGRGTDAAPLGSRDDGTGDRMLGPGLRGGDQAQNLGLVEAVGHLGDPSQPVVVGHSIFVTINAREHFAKHVENSSMADEYKQRMSRP